MENHTGNRERSEMFNGKRYRKAHSCRTKVAAEEKKFALIRKGNLARVEQESRGHWNVYTRKKR